MPASAVTVSEPIAEGFAGPLGLAVGDDGTFYVAEAFGGQLTTIDKHGTREVVVARGSEIAGVDARGKGNVAFVETFYEPGAPPGEPTPVIDANLSTIRPNGATTTVMSTQQWEEDNNPDGNVTYGFEGASADCLATLPSDIPAGYPGIVESHPYAVAIVDGGWIVADAAGNDLLEVGRNGRVSTLAVLPRIANEITAEVAFDFGLDPCFVGTTYWGEPVPTDVEVGPDGDYYVTALPGGPELPGTGAVFRVDANGDVELVASGFDSAVDLAVADDGTIYVAELFPGRISVVDGGSAVPWAEISQPTALEFGPDGTLYATAGGILFGDGQLVAITP